MVFLPGGRTGTASWGMGIHFSEEGAEDIAYDALVAWKAKVLKRVDQVRDGATNAKGLPLPDAFVGEKLGTRTKRNLIADIGRFVFNQMMSQRKTTAHRAQLAPMDPLATEHEGERGEDETAIGHHVSTGETPASEITGAEQTRDIMGMFRTISRDLRRAASEEAGDLLDAILKTNSFDERELATELGWTRKKLRSVRTVLGSYIKHRAKTHPELRRLPASWGRRRKPSAASTPCLISSSPATLSRPGGTIRWVGFRKSSNPFKPHRLRYRRDCQYRLRDHRHYL